ncbi:MAG: PEP-CTERM sorting domain-containing protein [Luteolibacter sp.]
MKSRLLPFVAVFMLSHSMNAAIMVVSNRVDGITDALYVDGANNPLTTGNVLLGVFLAADFDVVANQSNLIDLMGNFTSLASGLIYLDHVSSPTPLAGYADAAPVDIGVVGTGSVYYNKVLYSIVFDGSSPETSTSYALLRIGTIMEDVGATTQTYSSDPWGAESILVGDFINNYPNAFSMLQLAPIPEPTTALLSGVGLLTFLSHRRRRH